MRITPRPDRRPALAALLVVGALVACGCGGSSASSSTPLDDYVAAPDPAFALEQPAAEQYVPPEKPVTHMHISLPRPAVQREGRVGGPQSSSGSRRG